ncbi:hypothetical protein [Candidatus Nitrosocosmicus franklandus]|uniref:Integrase SSV1 C-terminal domain-containing protein n=1 Tax=Candidatus Nitrosocosmicus franklandianus TaxID=1798806 RepID=A0A484I4Y9_9ARCH|nr:hypothetical protein [Candidatus Nitrosocosmicus franklandus]VFJ12808.1 conserved protein of unknown function [Candidatus Nitrosocosmicus franklandus]
MREQIDDYSTFDGKKHIGLNGFLQYLLSLKLNPATIKTRMACAKYYHHLLVTRDFSEIMEFSIDKKKHIMKSLALLSKYLGCSETWHPYTNRYKLKWTAIRDSLTSFHSITNQDKDFSNMLGWLKNAIEKYLRFYNIVKFRVLIGLRPVQILKSFALILNPESKKECHSQDGKVIEHFRFPSIFLRRTKKVSYRA